MVEDVVTASRSSDVLQIPFAPSATPPERLGWAPLQPFAGSPGIRCPSPVPRSSHRRDTFLLLLLRCRLLSCLSSWLLYRCVTPPRPRRCCVASVM